MKKNLVMILLIVVLLVGACGKVKDGTQTNTKTETSTQTSTENHVNTNTSNTDGNTDGDSSTGNNGGPSFCPIHGNGTFADYYDKALERLEAMTLEEKVGQVFLARCPENIEIESIKNYHLGGYVLFRRDFEGKTEQEVITMIESFQRESRIPMIIATDEEGGSVVRISSNPNLSDYRFGSPQEVFLQGGYEAIYKDALVKGKLLKKLGVNLNLAPVSDMTSDQSAYIYGRTFGKSAEETGEFVKTVVEATKEVGIGSSLKHFPGYGGNADTHTGIATDTRQYQVYDQYDFIPFVEGIQAGAETIMVNHNIVTAMDEEFPASLSPRINHILREELGFTGVILTDDLEMDAIKLFTNNENPAVQALKAGNDMLIITDFEEGYDAILEAIQDGELSKERLDEAVFRILALKYYLGLLK